MSNPNSKDNQSSIKENMQNNIVSMLKGAGIIEGNDNEFYKKLKKINLNKEEYLDLDNLNIRRSSFIKETNNRPFLYSNEELTQNNNIPFYRNDTRKFSIEPYYQNPLYSINNNFLFDISRRNYYYNNPISYNNNTFLFPKEKNTNKNFQTNSNLIPITTTPLGMRMPIRTFNFKTKQNVNLKDNNNQNTILNIPINDEPIARDLESLLIKNGFFINEIYNK